MIDVVLLVKAFDGIIAASVQREPGQHLSNGGKQQVDNDAQLFVLTSRRAVARKQLAYLQLFPYGGLVFIVVDFMMHRGRVNKLGICIALPCSGVRG